MKIGKRAIFAMCTNHAVVQYKKSMNKSIDGSDRSFFLFFLFEQKIIEAQSKNILIKEQLNS
jgi:hypothetical protein